MRRNTKFTFTKKEDRPALNHEEMEYWKGILSKICKIGFEHEYNLVEPTGSCSGNIYACPCSNPKKETTKCNEQCIKKDTCKLLSKLECPGVYCILFESPCPTCKDKVRDCTKCELYDDPKKRPDGIRKALKSTLSPSGSLADIGSCGIYSIADDGSLLGNGGVEIATVGRRVNYTSFYEQSRKICESCTKAGAYLNERTSIHMHLVSGYFSITSGGSGKINIVYDKKNRNSEGHQITELEKPMPEIILANFHQLFRRYQNALTWVSSSGTSENALTRWSKFRKPILKYSTLRQPMNKIQEQMAAAIQNDGKYAFLSYYNTRFDDEGKVKRMHVEARFCDGLLAPSAIASMGILLYALFMKAVTLSQYGILHSGTPEYSNDSYIIQEKLLNNDGPYGSNRLSDTSGFAPYIETVRKQASEMITLLSPELKKHGQSLRVLQKLAEFPCSIQLIQGKTWEEIESFLVEKNANIGPSKMEVLNAVDTQYIDDCINKEEWITSLADGGQFNKEVLSKAMEELISEDKIFWNNKTGTFIRC